jgi:hypothetical protein
VFGRLKKYHLLVWTTALLFALTLSLQKNQYGYWGVDSSLHSSICWIDSDPDQLDDDDDAATTDDDDQIISPVINYRPFVYFYIPVIIFYSYILYIMICAKRILSRGIHTSFLHRIHTLQISQFILTVFLGYWISQACCYFTSDLIHSKYPQVASYLYNLLLFGMSAKGFPCLLVYLILMKSENKLLQIADEQDRQRSPTQTTGAPTITTSGGAGGATSGGRVGTSIDTSAIIEMNLQDTSRETISNPLASSLSAAEQQSQSQTPYSSPSLSAFASGTASLGDTETLLFDVNTTLQNQVFVYITLGMKILAKRLTPEPKELVTIRFRVPTNFIVPSHDLKVISGSSHNLQMLVQCDHDQVLSNIVQANSDFMNESSSSILSSSPPFPSPYPLPPPPPPSPSPSVSSSSLDLNDPGRVGSSDFDIEELENQKENARVSVTSPHRSAKFSFNNSIKLMTGGELQISLCGNFLLPPLPPTPFPSLPSSSVTQMSSQLQFINPSGTSTLLLSLTCTSPSLILPPTA